MGADESHIGLPSDRKTTWKLLVDVDFPRLGLNGNYWFIGGFPKVRVTTPRNGESDDKQNRKRNGHWILVQFIVIRGSQNTMVFLGSP